MKSATALHRAASGHLMLLGMNEAHGVVGTREAPLMRRITFHHILRRALVFFIELRGAGDWAGDIDRLERFHRIRSDTGAGDGDASRVLTDCMRGKHHGSLESVVDSKHRVCFVRDCGAQFCVKPRERRRGVVGV